MRRGAAEQRCADAELELLLNQCSDGDQRTYTGADPWHSFSALEHDCVLLVEFCETEGPRVLHMVPTQRPSHFEPADFALWLMTADYQTGCRTVASGLHVPTDVQSITRNVDQGIYTFAHHFTLFDIQARGFVRPFCLSYLTPDAEKMADISLELISHCQNAVDAIKHCNRRIFKKQLEASLEVLDSVETQAVSTYYELCYDTQSPDKSSGDPTKVEAMALRMRRLHREFTMAYKNLQSHYADQDRACTSQASPSHSASQTDSLNEQLRAMRQSTLLLHDCDSSAAAPTDLSNQLRAQRQQHDSGIETSRTEQSMCTSAHSTISWHTDQWLDTLLADAQLHAHEKQLQPLSELAPCVHAHFCRQVRQLWSQFHRRSSVLRLFAELHGKFGPSQLRLYADSLPLLSVPVDRSDGTGSATESESESTVPYLSRAHPMRVSAGSSSRNMDNNNLDCENNNHIKATPPDDDEPTPEVSMAHSSSVTEWEESRSSSTGVLLPLLKSLPDLLMPIWTGQCLIVCAADSKKLQVMQTVQALRRLLPSAASHATYLAWCQPLNRVSTSRLHHTIDPTILADYKICGHQLHQNQPLSSLLPDNVRSYVSVLDLNQAQTHTPVDRTRILASLNGKTNKMFSSERSLRCHMRCLLADYAQCAYVLYHLIHTQPDVYRKNLRFLHKFSQQLNLDVGDFKIVRYLLELLIQQEAQSNGQTTEPPLFLDATKMVTKNVKFS